MRKFLLLFEERNTLFPLQRSVPIVGNREDSLFAMKEIISIYSPDKPYTVYHQDYWWSDKWNPMDYGGEFDFSRGFFEQFEELSSSTPKPWLTNFDAENCIYANYLNNSKDTYMSFASGFVENLLYSKWVFYSENSTDCTYSDHIQNSYELLDCVNMYECYYCQDCKDINSCIFCYDCKWCNNCIGCVWLRNKQYHIYNQAFSKDEFLWKKWKHIALQDVHQKFFSLKNEFWHQESNKINTENSIGDNLNNTSNCIYCFGLSEWKECKFCIDSLQMVDCYDVNNSGYVEKMYETVGGGYYSDICFVNWSADIHDSLYSELCFSSSHLFGCIGLRNKSYCIFNKQYTKEEYEELVPRIIEHMMKTGEWGEFFPATLSPFGYNETVAMEYFPLSREAVLGEAPFWKELSGAKRKTEDFQKIETENPSPAIAGTPFQKWAYFNWSDYEAPFPKVDKIIPASKLPDDISKIPDDILNWAIECEITKRPFRIIKQELEFYRKHNLPIPRRHPDQRHLDRMALRNPRKLFERKCDKCGKDMITSYSPEREEIVYCEECYNKEVIG